MPDHYAEFDEEEAELRSLLFAGGFSSGGALWALQRVPPRIRLKSGAMVPLASLVRRRDAGRFLSSPWWANVWKRLELRASDVARRLAIESSLPLVRKYASKITEARVDRLAAEASELAGRYVVEARQASAAGAELAFRDLDIQRRDLVEQLRLRLGATPTQIEKISKWEKRAIAEGKLSADEIATELKRRGRVAIRVRAEVWASDLMVEAVSSTRVSALRLAGRLISSGNPLDKKTRPQHAAQTRATRAAPTPAGRPWTPSAPFRGLMPYEHLCRCWIEDAGPVRKRP